MTTRVKNAAEIKDATMSPVDVIADLRSALRRGQRNVLGREYSGRDYDRLRRALRERDSTDDE